MNESRNALIKNVTFFWTKLNKPVDNYAGDNLQWEVQARVPKARRAELEQFMKVKEQDDGTVSCNFSKKAFKADGSAAQPVRLVDASKEPITERDSIGNGSKGNIILMLKDYEIKNPKTGKVTKSGTSCMLTAVQITDLKVYERTNSGNFTDFDDESEEKPKAKAKAKKADLYDDDIPF